MINGIYLIIAKTTNVREMKLIILESKDRSHFDNFEIDQNLSVVKVTKELDKS